jgi:hypothetical protein
MIALTKATYNISILLKPKQKERSNRSTNRFGTNIKKKSTKREGE